MVSKKQMQGKAVQQPCLVTASNHAFMENQSDKTVKYKMYNNKRWTWGSVVMDSKQHHCLVYQGDYKLDKNLYANS